MVNPATTAGPKGNGANSLAKESKSGILTTLLVGSLLLALQGFIDDRIDVTTLPGWAQGAASYLLGSLAGLFAAYKKKNR